MKSNLDALEEMMRKRGAREAAEPKTGRYEPLGWIVEFDGTEDSQPQHKATSTASGQGDPEIQAMNAEAPLLELIQADTGETGKKSGDRYDFRRCPVCGHRDCFSYYESSNSWSCFSESNKTEYEGGMYTEYQKAAHGCNDTEAVRRLREATGHPFESEKPGDRGGGGDDKFILPKWEHVRVLDPPKRKPVLIPGILRRGHVAVVVSKGKAGKTCSVMELCVCTVTGREWFGRAIENGGDCLFVDPEVDNASAHTRFNKLCESMNLDDNEKAEVERHVIKWGLRGVREAKIENIVKDIKLARKLGELDDLALIVLDSASIFIEGDQNAADVIRAFSFYLFEIAEITGASVVAVAHTGKAKDGDRSAADRARGSSVWLDFPDALVTLSETFPPSGEPSEYLGKGRFGCIMEAGGLREFPKFEPVRTIFEYPAHALDVDGITEGWKVDSSARNGGRQTGEGNRAKSAARASKCEAAIAAEFIAEGIGAEGIAASEAAEIASESIGETVKTSTLKGYIEDSELFDVEQVSKQRWRVVPKRKPKAPQEPPPTLDLEQT